MHERVRASLRAFSGGRWLGVGMNRSSPIEITTEDIAAAMRRLRLRKGLPQKAVADALDISQSTLSKMERGVLEPSAIQWMRFCQLIEEPMDIVLRWKQLKS